MTITSQFQIEQVGIGDLQTSYIGQTIGSGLTGRRNQAQNWWKGICNMLNSQNE